MLPHFSKLLHPPLFCADTYVIAVSPRAMQKMPLSNILAAACFDRTVSFYDMLTGEFFCRIGGLRSSPTCVDCVEVS